MTLNRYLADAAEPQEERGRLADALHPEGFSTADPAAGQRNVAAVGYRDGEVIVGNR
jgi:hypothetical protein